MKKIFILVSAFIVCLAAIIFASKSTEHTKASSQLLLKNVSVLAQSEWDGWAKGKTMKLAHKYVGFEVVVGYNARGPIVEVHWQWAYVNCCSSTTQYDAYNTAGESSHC